MKRIFVEYADDPSLLAEHLEANADKIIDDYHYVRELTEIEKIDLEQRYLELSKKLDALQDEFKIIKEEFDLKVNPIKKQIGVDIKMMRQNRIHEKGTVYLIDDYDNRLTLVYNERGYCIEQQPLRTKQKTINSELRQKQTA